MSAKSPNAIDRHIGERIRIRRLMLGVSQEKLGEALGVSFQQVQKYERGANRVGSGRLQQIASVLKAPISYFYEAQEGAGSEPAPEPLLRDKDGVELLQAFNALTNPALRRAIVNLVRAASDTDGDHGSTTLPFRQPGRRSRAR